MIIPALDLIDGQVVRLHRGDYAKQRDYGADPLSRLQAYEREGAELLHLVDLTGAKDPAKRQIRIAENLTGRCQRARYRSAAVSALKKMWRHWWKPALPAWWSAPRRSNPGKSKTLVCPLGRRTHRCWRWILRIGADGKTVAVSGWQEDSEQTIEDVIRDFASAGLRHVLCTDISERRHPGRLQCGALSGNLCRVPGRFPFRHPAVSAG